MRVIVDDRWPDGGEELPRVLHCVERLHRNAIETWLVRMWSHAAAKGIPLNWRFHVQFAEKGALEEQRPELTGFVLRSPVSLSNWRRFFFSFFRELRKGKFDVVHIHADLMSAPYLIMAKLARVGRIVVHVHNADEAVPVGARWKKKTLRGLFRWICLAGADCIVGISQHALDTFLAGRRRRPGRDIVHYYGIDPAPFLRAKGDRTGFRREIGLPEDSQIFLFAGRMVTEKNPLFAVEVFAEMRQRDSRVSAVFVGSGSLEAAVRRRAEEFGVSNHFRALGWRDDVPEIMSASDWFILPRPETPKEGLGIAVVEAQLAGLRLMLSRGIEDDPLLPTASFCRLALAAGPEVWAEHGLALLQAGKPDGKDAVLALANSPFDMDFALRDLLSVYAGVQTGN